MDYAQMILTVNFSSITMLVSLAAILLAATSFRGESGYAAAIIVLPNVPVYLYNMSRMLGWHEFTLFMFPISYSVNTLLMPLLWLFTKKNFDPEFRFRPSIIRKTNGFSQNKTKGFVSGKYGKSASVSRVFQ